MVLWSINLKSDLTIASIFSCCKADDESRLPPAEEDNAGAWKIGRKGGMVFRLLDYITVSTACPFMGLASF